MSSQVEEVVDAMIEDGPKWLECELDPASSEGQTAHFGAVMLLAMEMVEGEVSRTRLRIRLTPQGMKTFARLDELVPLTGTASTPDSTP